MAIHKDSVLPERLEIVEVGRRRRWSETEKLRIVMETLEAPRLICKRERLATVGYAARLRYAKLRHQAVVEDVDYTASRGLDRKLFQSLCGGALIAAHDNLILTGPTGTGKSWLASAIGHSACRDNRSVLYQRVIKLFANLALARGDGRYARIMRTLVNAQLLIIHDWGLEPLDEAARHDMLEILEDRYGRKSTIVTSQIPVDRWHAVINHPTYADAILDRLVHNAHRIVSLRRGPSCELMGSA